ncbi:MAG TPA: nodulation protein NfeD [Candidatus Eisenbacteria bacterium]|nr:nodulation protein NfeD [Candidatus Eisenbacteria bacterium]
MNRLAARGLLALALLIAIIAAVPAPAKIEADSTGATSGRPQVDVLTWEGPVQPIMAETVIQAIDRAEKAHREALVIRLDTPGGLDTSMRDVIKRILISEVPIVVYVAPSGGRAASAGTFIGMASHVLAMSPGTSIGAATPVNVGGQDVAHDMANKVKNDAVSYIRSLARQRGRNADWAEKAVREGSSLNEEDALHEHVIDLVARNMEDLLKAIDGRSVTIAGETRTLHTANAQTHEYEASWRQKFLGRIIDPNIAYILFILGFYGLLFELSNPGAVLPGVVGGICLLLAFLAFQALPVNLTGVALIVFAMLLFAADVKVQSHGILTVGGAAALLLGSIILLGGDRGVARISLSVILTAVGASVAFFGLVIGAGLRAQRRKPTTGAPGMVGKQGTAMTDLGPSGQVFVRGEYWTAEADQPIAKGARVVVDRVEGLVLRVKKA